MQLQDGSGACFGWEARERAKIAGMLRIVPRLVCVGSGIVGNCYYQCDPNNPDCPFEVKHVRLSKVRFGVCEPFGGTTGGGGTGGGDTTGGGTGNGGDTTGGGTNGGTSGGGTGGGPLVVLAIRLIPATLRATVVLSVRAMSSVFHAPVTPRTLAIRTAPAT